MRSFSLFAAILVALSAEAVLADGNNSPYLAALQSRPQLQNGHSAPPNPLGRSSSGDSIHRLARNPTISQNRGRSQSLDNGRNRGDCRTNYKVDYVQLTLMWGPGFCATSPRHCVKSENRLFTVHGMWPQLRNQNSPTDCCFNNNFWYKDIEPLVPTLNKYWFSYYDKDSRGFWSHEWIKHGTCLRDNDKLQGEKKFFGTVLEIMKRLPLLETLKKAGIVPGSNKIYSSQSVINTIRGITNGKNIQIDCDLEAHQPTPLLTGLNICFDNDLAFTDCPPSKSRCRRDVYFMDK